jgi:hypothetical protein
MCNTISLSFLTGLLLNKLSCTEWKRSIWSSKEHWHIPLAWKPKRYYYYLSGPKDNGQSWCLCGNFFSSPF